MKSLHRVYALVLGTLGLVVITSCGASAPPPICQARAAWDTGRTQALAGQSLNYDVGSMCQGKSQSEFQSQLYAGYNDGLAQFCVPAMAQDHGRRDGRAGRAGQFDPRRYSICTRQDGFADAYNAGHAVGVSEYCVPTAGEKLGYETGMTGTSSVFDSRPFAICTSGQLEQIVAGYRQAHTQGVAAFCEQSVQRVHSEGLVLGRRGSSASFNSSGYGLCSIPQIKAAFSEGQKQGLQEFCSPTSASEAGQKRGLAGERNAWDGRAYQACSSQQKQSLRQAYTQGHLLGMGTYCQTIVQTAVSTSRLQGEQGKPSQLNQSYGNCPRQIVAQARSEASRAYTDGLGRYCSIANIESMGRDHGRQGNVRSDVLRKYRVCSPQTYSNLQARYQSGVNAGLAVFCGGPRLREAARQVAQTSPNGRLPRAFGVCVQAQPDISRIYQQYVIQEREQVVATQCTFQRGAARGRDDARESNQKRTQVPAYCDRTAFNAYLSGYLDGWKGQKGAICSPIQAYELGRRHANNGQNSSYQAPDLCRRQANALSNKYLEGYRDTQRAVQDKQRRDQWERDQRAQRDRDQRAQRDRDQQDRDRNQRVKDQQDDRRDQGDRRGDWRERELQRRIAKLHEAAKRDAYSTCLKKGYGPSSCKNVTNRVCLEKGYGPSSCNLPTRHLKAVNTCLKKGYGPSSCPRVTSVRCLEKGYGPSSCALSVPVTRAVDLCLDKGYGPSSCDGATNYECLKQGHSPSACKQ